MVFGSPLAPILANQAFFFGCNPESAYSHLYNDTVHLTYFDSASPNSFLVEISLASDQTTLGAYYMTYDDSQGDGNLAVITAANVVTEGGGQANVTYEYDNYVLQSFYAMNEFSSQGPISLISQGEDDKTVAEFNRTERRPVFKTPQLLISRAANILSRFPEPTETDTVVTTEVSFTYDSNGRLSQESITSNTTTVEADSTNDVVTFKYKTDTSGQITSIAESVNGVASGTITFTYDKKTSLITKTCYNGCTNYKETYVYDTLGRTTEIHLANGNVYKFKYDGAQIHTADFGTDYGLWSFSYTN